MLYLKSSEIYVKLLIYIKLYHFWREKEGGQHIISWDRASCIYHLKNIYISKIVTIGYKKLVEGLAHHTSTEAAPLDPACFLIESI